MWPDRLRFRKTQRASEAFHARGDHEGGIPCSAASAGDKPYFDCQRLPQEIGRRLCEQLAGAGPLAPPCALVNKSPLSLRRQESGNMAGISGFTLNP